MLGQSEPGLHHWQAVLANLVHDLIEQGEAAGVDTEDVLSRLIQTQDAEQTPSSCLAD